MNKEERYRKKHFPSSSPKRKFDRNQAKHRVIRNDAFYYILFSRTENSGKVHMPYGVYSPYFSKNHPFHLEKDFGLRKRRVLIYIPMIYATIIRPNVSRQVCRSILLIKQHLSPPLSLSSGFLSLVLYKHNPLMAFNLFYTHLFI